MIVALRHDLAKHLRDKNRQQSRAVPEWVEAVRFALAHKFHAQKRRRFFFAMFPVAAPCVQSAGSTGFFDRTRARSEGFGTFTDTVCQGRDHAHGQVQGKARTTRDLPVS
jgi:hypothetical protein